MFEAKVKVLSGQGEQHKKAEEEEMFPGVKKSLMDLVAPGDEIAARRDQLIVHGF